MFELRSHSKLRADHLTRPALIYSRQSPLMQVRENTASPARQYQLTQRVRELGWPAQLSVVIDQDQGRAGASAVGRTGFEYLIAEVGLGRAGAVVSLEASRLARSSSDWYRLIEICALTDTLGIDEDGIYDPGQYNDRLLLGFRGTRSEAELHWLHCRLVGGKLEKAPHGPRWVRLTPELLTALRKPVPQHWGQRKARKKSSGDHSVGEVDPSPNHSVTTIIYRGETRQSKRLVRHASPR
jgi:DNA invertase Pin-like site-specific DNA recombinase